MCDDVLSDSQILLSFGILPLKRRRFTDKSQEGLKALLLSSSLLADDDESLMRKRGK